jgi:hypothetical protein
MQNMEHEKKMFLLCFLMIESTGFLCHSFLDLGLLANEWSQRD